MALVQSQHRLGGVLIRETAHGSESLDHVADLTAVAGQSRAALLHLFTSIYSTCLRIEMYLSAPSSSLLCPSVP